MELRPGIFFGLTAMVFWGLADFLSARSAKTLGTRKGAFWFHVGALLFLIPLTPWFGGGNQIKREDILPLAGLSLLFVGVLVLFLRATNKGLVAIVLPIFACHVIVPVIAGLLLFGERLNPPAIAALSIILVGLVLVTSDWRDIQKVDRSALAKGLPEAIGSMFCAGIVLTLMTSLSREHGWFMPLLSMRIGGLLIITIMLLRGPRPYLERDALRFAIHAGLFDIFAFSLFSIGVTLAPVTVVAPISGTAPFVAIVLAYIFLRERLAPNQWAGVVAIIGGIVLLGLTGG